jgi:hypothetical protein
MRLAGKPIQERFANNILMMHKHIARNLDHFIAYCDVCIVKDIPVNKLCVPNEEKKWQAAAQYVVCASVGELGLKLPLSRSSSMQQASIAEYTHIDVSEDK